MPSKRQALAPVDASVPARPEPTQAQRDAWVRQHTLRHTAWPLPQQQKGAVEIGDYLSLDEEHKVLICLLCRAGVKPGKGVEAHFRSAHQLTGDRLKQIVLYSSRVEVSDPDKVQLPADGSRPITELLIRRGFSCTRCRYLTTARDNITAHWRTTLHGTTERRWTEVFLQAWPNQRRHLR